MCSGTYTVQLTVNDGFGSDSASVTVSMVPAACRERRSQSDGHGGIDGAIERQQIRTWTATAEVFTDLLSASSDQFGGIVQSPRRNHYVRSRCGRNVYCSTGCQRRHIQQPGVHRHRDHGEHSAGGECRSEPKSQRRGASVAERRGSTGCERQPAHVPWTLNLSRFRKQGNTEQPHQRKPDLHRGRAGHVYGAVDRK